MACYNPDIHHRRSIRLQGYDYSQAGAYFVTICVYRRECLFGEVVNGEAWLNPYGETVRDWWQSLPSYRANVELDDFGIMPNHMHGILVITDALVAHAIPENVGTGFPRPSSSFSPNPPVNDTTVSDGQNRSPFSSVEDGETQDGRTQDEKALDGGIPSLQETKRTLGQLMGYFKYQSTKGVNAQRDMIGVPIWQPRFHDHIIRCEDELNRIREYMALNPVHWEEDQYHPANPQP